MRLVDYDFDIIHYGVDAGNIYDITSLLEASTPSDDAVKAAPGINYACTRVPCSREGTGPFVVRKNSPLPGCPARAIFVVVMGALAGVIGTPHSQACSIPTFKYHKAGLIILIKSHRALHLLFWDGTFDPEEVVKGIMKGASHDQVGINH